MISGSKHLNKKQTHDHVLAEPIVLNCELAAKKILSPLTVHWSAPELRILWIIGFGPLQLMGKTLNQYASQPLGLSLNQLRHCLPEERL